MPTTLSRFSRAAILALSFVAAPAAQADYNVTCGSVGGRHNTCRLSEPGYVTLTKQISGARCEQGRSWDYDRREIWVDNGCEAEFRVERWGYRRDGQPSTGGPTASSSSSRDAATAAAVIAGAAILGALANNKDHQDDYKYRDQNYYGPRHTSYVPGWMVGTFRGYNPLYGAEVTMTIRPDGRMAAMANNQPIDGYVNDEQLHVGPVIFDIDQTRDGFVTSQKGDRHNEVRYRRIN
ncbi:MAG: DUF3011 domain-containing protein [Betaproteobacteria bacterium]|nr:DUF3011 domain-containing protein [Betaproteobacteria bacterium]MDH5286458.1 DUF3011 domain-containing protein [Betaproteobacteria bacterium]